MNFELTGEIKELQERTRQFVENVVMPHEEGWPLFIDDAPREVVLSLRRKCREAGLVNIDVPKEYGGLGMGCLAHTVATEEFNKTVIPLFHHQINGGYPPHPAFYEANDYQKEKYLRPLIRGDKFWCFGFTEPQVSGSNLREIETTATRDGDNYILNGQKIFATFADIADFVLYAAYTDKKKGLHGMSTFLVDKGTPGIRVEKKFLCFDWTHQPLLRLVNCVVPAANLLGKEGEGFYQGMNLFNRMRIQMAVETLGKSERCFDTAVKYAKQRRAFGKRIGEFQAIQWMLADSKIDIETIRWLTYYAAWKADQGEDFRAEPAMAKVHGVEAALRVIDRTMQVLGGMGLSIDFPFFRFLGEVRRTKSAEGTLEIMRLLIARAILGRDVAK
jgi:alkylation response protein AidB-like acyl-CoA dehydrogenase